MCKRYQKSDCDNEELTQPEIGKQQPRMAIMSMAERTPHLESSLHVLRVGKNKSVPPELAVSYGLLVRSSGWMGSSSWLLRVMVILSGVVQGTSSNRQSAWQLQTECKSQRQQFDVETEVVTVEVEVDNGSEWFGLAEPERDNGGRPRTENHFPVRFWLVCMMCHHKGTAFFKLVSLQPTDLGISNFALSEEEYVQAKQKVVQYKAKGTFSIKRSMANTRISILIDVIARNGCMIPMFCKARGSRIEHAQRLKTTTIIILST
ncbi:uncharacterized protein F5147DRAFT_655190 [Suillus discolor]|uniref:Uncharacterized protein n=1 Tax=Suillus discolor TaxID=1912936 RepID=A0A9P7F1F0_9AGAM|nr:uncharacterized protein F5147DRAFT_655190 [Suillus discolor]KAG2101877.1 hypothetical protein F5147DRAFT_655190 [Suillus discolor]